MVEPLSEELLAAFQQRYPKMDLQMVRFFSQTMMIFHRVPIVMERYFTSLGLSKGRFQVMIQLHGIDDEAGISIRELIDSYQVSSPTMTGIIDTLEGEGLLERISCPHDRRKVHVRITESGRSFMDEFLPIHHEHIQRFSDQLSIEERESLLGLLKKLHQGITNGLADPPASR